MSKPRRTLIRSTIALSLLGVAFGAGYQARQHGLSFFFYERVWSIALYEGSSPVDLAPRPGAERILTREDVTDVPADFVADPFLFEKGGRWYLFFEILNATTQQGDIGLAISDDLEVWRYERVVLDEPFHLSYPLVLEDDGEIYMLPETYKAGAVRLYRATAFPHEWELAADLMGPRHLVDPTAFRYDGKWWMFAAGSPSLRGRLHLFFADRLLGPWTPHPLSPVVADDPNHGRPGGRVVADGGRLYRFGQDGHPTYGVALRAFEIERLTTTQYAEREVPSSPILSASGRGWNKDGMHHADPHRLADGSWIAAVDGHTWLRHLKLPFGD